MHTPRIGADGAIASRDDCMAFRAKMQGGAHGRTGGPRRSWGHGRRDAEAAAHRESAASSIGAALLGRSAGDTFVAELPGGRIERLRILGVHAAADAAR
jgi:hypothetical protein